MKIRQLAKLIQRSSLTSSAAMSLHPVKDEPLSPMGIACSSKEMERKSNYFRKHLSFSFAKVSKAEYCFVMLRKEKSTHLSIVEITKTSSGARVLTNRL